MENKIKINAEAFEKLLTIEYYFCLAYKGNGFEVRVRFAEEDFHHLEGIGQLRDLKIHSESGNITFEKALDGLFTTNKRQMNVDRIFNIVVLRLKHVFS